MNQIPVSAINQTRFDCNIVLFLSHSGADTQEAQSLAEHLRNVGVDVWLDAEKLKPGDRWMEALEEALQKASGFAVYVGRSGVKNWVDREVRFALDRNTADPGFRIFPILGPGAVSESVPPFLKQHQWLDLSEGVPSAAELKPLVAAILDLPAEKVSLLPEGQAPFLGLRFFDTKDAMLFYGRDHEVEELLERLQQEPFLAVVGDSGSGKSSLVRAGLIPALLRGRFRSNGAWAPSWRVAVLRPADDPFRELANALPDLDAYGQVRGDVLRSVEKDVKEGTSGLYRAIVGLMKPGDRTLLVVDQFEELFTIGKEGDRPDVKGLAGEQKRFIDSLLAAAQSGGDRPVHVVVTLRADFYSHCWRHEDLPSRIAASQYAVQRIRAGRLEEVVEKPLALAGATAETGLVRRILDDAGDSPGSLPLLEHALEQLWARRKNDKLTHLAYEAIGGLEGALRRHAEGFYGELQPEEQNLIPKILLRLIQPGEGSEDTKRVALLRELDPLAAEPGSARAVVKRLADARIISVTGGDVSGEEASEQAVAEVAHEALIREWPRLREWIDTNREDLRTERRLEAAAREWERQRDEVKPDYLHTGARLVEAEEWASKQEHVLEGVQQFLAASIEKRDRAFREEDERRRQELETAHRLTEESEARAEAEKKGAQQARKAARKLGFALGAIALAFFGAAFFYYDAREQRGAAESARDQAEGLIDFMLFSLRDKLRPIGRLELLDDVNDRVAAYYASIGGGGSFEQQRRRSAALTNHGDVLLAQGNLAEALEAYEAGRAIDTRLTEQDPSNAGWQRDLSVSYNKVGDVLLAQGKLEEALQAYEASRAIAGRLAEQDPSNTGWQRILSVTHNKVGDVLVAQGKLGGGAAGVRGRFSHRGAAGGAGPQQRGLAGGPGGEPQQGRQRAAGAGEAGGGAAGVRGEPGDRGAAGGAGAEQHGLAAEPVGEPQQGRQLAGGAGEAGGGAAGARGRLSHRAAAGGAGSEQRGLAAGPVGEPQQGRQLAARTGRVGRGAGGV